MATGMRWTQEQVDAARKRCRPAHLDIPTMPEADRTALVRATMPKAKYRNRKTETEHGKFDSQKEAQRYAELVVLERAGAIAGLRRQVPFALVVAGVYIGKYVADMVYKEGEKVVVEDVKGFKTEVYRLKRLLMLACHNVEIKES